MERITERLNTLLGSLDIGNLPVAIQIARLPEQIRGFGHVKERQLAEAQRERELLLRRFGVAK